MLEVIGENLGRAGALSDASHIPRGEQGLDLLHLAKEDAGNRGAAPKVSCL